ncbi:MAG TPA: hypothetical protein VGU71_13170 [Candidatus Dormibacteraeota bacterium]|nr:hypothetical protein [Candidatus Dormibacteraeota bacterium]
MAKVITKRARPDIDAAERGGDWSQRMDGEGLPAQATIAQALYWKEIYTEILAMEEKVLAKIRKLMVGQSAEGQREVELTNVPVVVAQAERFRQRLGYWDARVQHLNGNHSGNHRPKLKKPA